MRIVRVLAAAILCTALACPVAAQAPPANETAKAMIGDWELSTADRERTCAVSFKVTPTGPGYRLDFDKACAEAFPLTKEVAAWTVGKNDAVQFLDAKGRILLELTEVESGMFEGLRAGDPLYFLQGMAAVGKERTADEMFGNWSLTRAGRSICELNLANTAADLDNFAISIKPGCDATITRVGFIAWRIDRGQLVIVSSGGETWRFEEDEPGTWRRIPAGRQPLALVRR
jgi:hypothetical protein